MNSTQNLSQLYSKCKNQLKVILNEEEIQEHKLLELINILCLDKTFNIKKDEEYNLDELSKIFRFYEEFLKESFNEDKEKFEVQLSLYLLLIKAFTELCNCFITTPEKIKNIDNFLQILKESKNMLKLFLPLDIKYINILNNLIGEQLYYFSHIQYHNIKAYPIEYTLEKYFMDFEKMYHGFDLSSSSEFGNKEFTNKDIEFAIFKNNASFLLLTLIYKIYKFIDIEIYEDKKFQNIINFYKNNFHKNIEKKEDSLKSFEKTVLEDFTSSAKYIKKIINHDILDSKLKILQLNTDEYKQLIDIIKKIDFQDYK